MEITQEVIGMLHVVVQGMIQEETQGLTQEETQGVTQEEKVGEIGGVEICVGICVVMATEEVGVEEMAEGTIEWKEGVRVGDGEMDPLETMVVMVVVIEMKIMSAVHVAMSLKVAGQLCLDK